MNLSRVLINGFKEQMARDHDNMDINFSIMVLGTNFWPLDPLDSKFDIPTDVSPLCNHFSEYYRRKHSRRKLVWLWDYSKNKLRMNYLNQEYTLMTSSYHMAILLQYNDHNTLTLGELVTATVINKDVLMQDLKLLVNAGVLINKEKDWYDLNLSNLLPSSLQLCN